MRVLPTVRSSGSIGAGAGRARAPRACALPSNAMLYSLLHLGGFAGDVDFYRGRTAGAARILELGSGDGRIGAALCAGAEYVGVERCADFVAAAAEQASSPRGKSCPQPCEDAPRGRPVPGGESRGRPASAPLTTHGLRLTCTTTHRTVRHAASERPG